MITLFRPRDPLAAQHEAFLMRVAGRDRDPCNFSPVAPSASDPSARIAHAARRGDVRELFARLVSGVRT